MYKPCVILGAGIAGLSAAYFLRQQGYDVVVLEKRPYYGGLARSFRWNNFWCDFSAHRFFTNNADVLAYVQALVPMQSHQRRSRIFLNHRWMRDPIDIIELLTHLPSDDRLSIIVHFLARDRTLEDTSFEHYVIKRYGRALYEIFFRHYTERLFSLPGHQIAVEWARWKVRLASPLDRLRPATKTKFRQFYYPYRGGYGSIVDRLYQHVSDSVLLEANVTSLERDSHGRITGVYFNRHGIKHFVHADWVISTLPITLNARLLNQRIDVTYQKVDAVYLLLNKPRMSENHWLYFMDRDSSINRIVEFKNMSSFDVPSDRTVVCAEVTRDVNNPIELVVQDLTRSNLIRIDDVVDAHVVREPFAYPRYTSGYVKQIQLFSQIVQSHPNFHVLGRAAQFSHYELDDIIEESQDLVKKVMQMQHSEVKILEPKNSHPCVWIVVLTYNNYKETEECLNSIRKLRYSRKKVILVDNGSSDGTPGLVREKFPEVVIVENGRNLGVPAGYNVGFRYALNEGADYIFMINNDTIVDHEMLDFLMEAAKEPNVGILMPLIYYYDDKKEIWSAGARYRRLPPAIVMEKRVYHDHYHELQYAISCGLLITRRAFEMVGLFDENFLFLWDDLDFSQRVRNAGLRILQVPRARMWHKVSRTTNPYSVLFWKTHGESGVIFYRRHGRPFVVMALIHLGYFALREFVIKWRLKFLTPFLKGVQSGLSRDLVDVPLIKDNISYP
jgi:GT2 family glycosyltransferase/protoporphyrinogen oxidase